MMEGIRIKKSEVRGRCVHAGREFKPGDVVLMEEPYAMIVREAYTEVCCSFCSAMCVNGTVFVLRPDDINKYCCEGCITNDYPIHMSELEALLNVAGKVEGSIDTMRLVIRISSLKASEKMKVVPKAEPIMALGRSNKYENIMSLEAATVQLATTAKNDIFRVAVFLSNTTTKANIPLSAVDANFLLLATQCNAHNIMFQGKPVAMGHPPRMVMRAIRDIGEGEELRYSYVPLYDSTQSRRDKLFKAYGFHCDCERCTCNISSDKEQGPDEGAGTDVNGPLGYPTEPGNAEAIHPAISPRADEVPQFPLDNCLSEPVGCDLGSVPVWGGGLGLEEDKHTARRCEVDFQSCAEACAQALNEWTDQRGDVGARAAGGPEADAMLLRLRRCHDHLLSTLVDPDVCERLHPAHKLVMQTCALLVRSGLELDEGKGWADEGDQVVGHRRWTVLRLALLALGCIVKYTLVRQREVVELEGLVSRALKLMLTEHGSGGGGDSGGSGELLGAESGGSRDRAPESANGTPSESPSHDGTSGGRGPDDSRNDGTKHGTDSVEGKMSKSDLISSFTEAVLLCLTTPRDSQAQVVGPGQGFEQSSYWATMASSKDILRWGCKYAAEEFAAQPVSVDRICRGSAIPLAVLAPYFELAAAKGVARFTESES